MTRLTRTSVSELGKLKKGKAMTTNCARRFPAAPVKAAPAAAAAAKLVVAVAGGPVLRPVAAAAARRGVGGGLAVAVVVAVVFAVAAIEAVASVGGGDVAVLVIAGAGSAAEKVLLDGRPSHLGLLLSHSADREETHHMYRLLLIYIIPTMISYLCMHIKLKMY